MLNRKLIRNLSTSGNSGDLFLEDSSEIISKVPSFDEYETVQIVQLINKAKFPIFLAYSPTTKRKFALKLFNFQDNAPHTCFLNEIRFAGLNHPNIITILYADQQTPLSLPGCHSRMMSCILMEYAPHGDLSSLIKHAKQNFTEKLTRTYFRQLIDAIEYLHLNGVYHLDIKLENILIGEDYQLKLADFDLSYLKGDYQVLTKGSKYYRAPEIQAGSDHVSSAADIYSAGIVLFAMKCRGVLPHLEEKPYRGVDLMELMYEDYEDFFETHVIIQEQESSFFDKDFKELFMSTTREVAGSRWTIREIKESKWYKGPIYSAKELNSKMKRFSVCS